MSGVNAYLTEAEGSTIDTAITDNEGFYTFFNVAAGNYTISFSTDNPPEEWNSAMHFWSCSN